MSKIRDRLSENVLAKRFLGNTGWILFERVLHVLLTLLTTSLTLRYLGTDGSGMIDYGASYVTIFTILCKLGIDSILVNEIVRGKQKPGELVGTTIGLRLLSALLSVVIIAVVVAVLKPGDTEVWIITVIQSASLLLVSFDTIDFWFQSQLQSRYTALSKAISFVLVCGFRLTLIALKADVYWFAFASVMDALIIGGMLMFFYRRTAHNALRFSWKTARYLLPLSAPFIVSALLITLYTQMDTIMLGSLAPGDTDSVVGIYNAAAKVCNMWVYVPCAIIDSARPMIMTQKGVDDESYQKRYRRLFAAVIWLCILAALGISFLSKWIIRIIAGEAFAASAPVLVVLIWARLFSIMGTTRGIWMVCENLSGYVVGFAAAGAAINFGINFFLIPRMGALGAAIATLITEFIVSVALNVCFKKTRPLARLVGEAFCLRKLK